MPLLNPRSSATFCSLWRRNRDSTSGRVLSACQPHSGLWRPAGVWRISCTAAPPFCRADNILRRVWMAGPDVRPRWTPPPRDSNGSRLLCCTHTCTAETAGVTNHKILTPSQHPAKPLPGKKATLELEMSQNRGIIFLENIFNSSQKVVLVNKGLLWWCSHYNWTLLLQHHQSFSLKIKILTIIMLYFIFWP